MDLSVHISTDVLWTCNPYSWSKLRTHHNNPWLCESVCAGLIHVSAQADDTAEVSWRRRVRNSSSTKQATNTSSLTRLDFICETNDRGIITWVFAAAEYGESCYWHGWIERFRLVCVRVVIWPRVAECLLCCWWKMIIYRETRSCFKVLVWPVLLYWLSLIYMIQIHCCGTSSLF